MDGENEIRTPDQRLRVFVSSTLQELAAERGSVRRAIESLRLAPVMFELGARAHPPRDLYRAYIEQSHIFIGIYWQLYGWMAPEMEISGLEDEFRCARGMPMLIYVREPAEQREERLEELLDSIRAEGSVSYRAFSTPEELADLVADDLAVLMTERFERTPRPGRTVMAPVANLPASVTSFIGRDKELRALADLLASDARLVTLTGPGGVGKTRLALEAGRASRGSFPDGVCFVSLQALDDPELVAPSIADALGLRPAGSSSSLDSIAEYLDGKKMLLILDNAEHVIAAARDLSVLVERCTGVKLLATSREPLHLRSEHVFQVPPLCIPDVSAPSDEPERCDSVHLFVDRAAAVRPDFTLTESNAGAVQELCRTLDGLPLAIELAAARIRVLSPEVMVQRLGARFDILRADLRDYPERQRTLRSTIMWSYELLDERERRLFAQLSVFEGSFSLEAVETTAELDGGSLVLDTLESLLDKSLIVTHPAGAEPRFRMFTVVRDLASERLAAMADGERMRDRHAAYFREVACAAYDGLRGAQQRDWMARLERDEGNIRAALHHFLDRSSVESVSQMVWSLWFFWWTRGRVEEGRRWTARGLAITGDGQDGACARLLGADGILAFWHGDMDGARPALERSNALFRAMGDVSGTAHTLLVVSLLEAFFDDPLRGRGGLAEALMAFREAHQPWGEAMTLIVLCWLSQAAGEQGPLATYVEALEVADQVGDELTVGMAVRNLAEYHVQAGRLEEAAPYLRRALSLFQRVRALDTLAYCLETTGRFAARAGDGDAAVRLFAAAEGMRGRARIPIWAAAAPGRDRDLDSFRAEIGDERYETAWAEGSSLDVEGAVGEGFSAMEVPQPV